MMADTPVVAPPRAAAKRGRHGPLVWLGIAVIFISQVPVTDGTLFGNVLRTAIVLALVVLVIARLPLLRLQLKGIELLGMAVLAGIVIITSLVGAVGGTSPEPAHIFRFLALNVLCYLAGKTLTSYEDCTRYLRYYYLLALFASVQAIIALALDFAGLRQLFAIPVFVEADRRYFLPWFGLLGGDSGNYRTSFYFSESTYFAQMLLPAIAYAIACRRGPGTLVLLAGFATTSSAAAGVALAAMLVLLLIRLRVSLWLPLLFATGCAALAASVLTLLHGNSALFLLLDRGHSVQSKLDTFLILWRELEAHPFGLGPINLSAHFGTLVNTSNGLFQLLVGYGVLGLLPLLWLAGALVPLALTRPRGALSAAMAIGLIAACMSGITHGPLIKYYGMFMLAVTITMARIESDEAPHPSARKAVSPIEPASRGSPHPVSAPTPP